MSISSYFHRRNWLLERETTLQHDMAQEICFYFYFLRKKGGTFEICLLLSAKINKKGRNNKFQDLINAPRS